MSSILITPRNIEEFTFPTEFFKYQKIKTKILSDEDKEDLGLHHLMKIVDRNKEVSRESIMNILDKKNEN